MPTEPFVLQLELWAEARRKAYPPIGDQLDAMYKARQGDSSALQAIDALIAEVKAAYPKPVEGAS